MEMKLNVSIGATLQVKNAKGEWDWVKPEVGCEIKLIDGEIKQETLQDQFAAMWDNVVGPQFQTVVLDLLGEQVLMEEAFETPKETEEVVKDVTYDEYD